MIDELNAGMAAVVVLFVSDPQGNGAIEGTGGIITNPYVLLGIGMAVLWILKNGPEILLNWKTLLSQRDEKGDHLPAGDLAVLLGHFLRDWKAHHKEREEQFDAIHDDTSALLQDHSQLLPREFQLHPYPGEKVWHNLSVIDWLREQAKSSTALSKQVGHLIELLEVVISDPQKVDAIRRRHEGGE